MGPLPAGGVLIKARQPGRVMGAVVLLDPGHSRGLLGLHDVDPGG